MYRTVFWTLWERVRVGQFGRIALKHVYYHMWSEMPVQVWCMIQDARGWCTGMIQRDGIGREVGGEYRMGNTCTCMADSCQWMAKPLQYCKVISLRINKLILKKRIKNLQQPVTPPLLLVQKSLNSNSGKMVLLCLLASWIKSLFLVPTTTTTKNLTNKIILFILFWVLCLSWT